MRKNGRLFIILGVGLACLAVALAFLMFQNAGKGKAVENVPVQVRVVVAAKDVGAHQILRDGDLTEETVDKDLLSGGEVFSRGDVLGLAPKGGLVKGQRVKKPDLEVPGLTNDITPGKRAVTIPVDRLQLAGGLLRDQDYIDMIFSIKVNLLYVFPTRPYEIETSTAGDQGSSAVVLPVTAPTEPAAYVLPGEPGSRFKIEGTNGKGDPLAKVILQDVKVIRVVSATPPQQGQQQSQKAAAVNDTDLLVLELTNQQAEVVKFALDNGASFAFALRGKDDHDPSQTGGITYDLLLTNYQLPTPKSVRLPGEKQP